MSCGLIDKVYLETCPSRSLAATHGEPVEHEFKDEEFLKSKRCVGVAELRERRIRRCHGDKTKSKLCA